MFLISEWVFNQCWAFYRTNLNCLIVRVAFYTFFCCSDILKILFMHAKFHTRGLLIFESRTLWFLWSSTNILWGSVLPQPTAPLAKRFDTFLVHWWPQFDASERLLFIFENRAFETSPSLAAHMIRCYAEWLWAVVIISYTLFPLTKLL